MKYRKKNNIVIVLTLVVLVIVGCGMKASKEKIPEKPDVVTESEKLAEGYRDIYEKAEGTNHFESVEKIVEYFGEAGYAAIDLENQMDMVNPEQMEDFAEKAENKQKAEVILFSITDECGFIRYDMQTEQGGIRVAVSTLKWQDGKPHAEQLNEFQAHTWKYTENGYFFIEEYRPAGFDGAPGEFGFRVMSLDKICRELNRKYVLPIGYGMNKLFITDWNQDNYENLDFYDLYEVMYQLKYDDYVPYESGYGGEEYEIPKEEFENIIKTYMPIESEVLEKHAVYHVDTKTYRYRPRGLHDCGFPYEPYPEVVDYEKLGDGTIKLTVNAVWFSGLTDQAVVSELIVRPLENEEFQYVSNRVISTEDGMEIKWYKNRLSDEAWQALYGEEN